MKIKRKMYSQNHWRKLLMNRKETRTEKAATNHKKPAQEKTEKEIEIFKDKIEQLQIIQDSGLAEKSFAKEIKYTKKWLE